MPGGAHLTITKVFPNGAPCEPKNNARSFVNQCGVIVRENIPINIQEWNKLKKDESASFVSNRLKDFLWNKLISFFTLPDLETVEKTEKQYAAVKKFALSKMATQFNKFKNNLYKDYLADGEPNEWIGPMMRQREYWPQFLEMKQSAIFKKRSETNKKNAAKKKKHHTMGTCGYKSFTPQWVAMEDEMRKQGIIPETEEWERRWANYALGHGATYNMQTGNLIAKKDQIVEPLKALRTAIKETKEGLFKPDREKDELTKALGNDEHGGRVRGFGPNVSWKLGFPEAHKGEEGAEAYRSRARAKRR